MDAEANTTYPFVLEVDGKDIGCIYLFSSPKLQPGWVDMMHFRVYEQKKGHGSKLLKKLCELADKHNVLLYTFPVVDDNSTMSFEKLREWYSKFGFIATGDIIMERKPNE